MKEDLKNRLAMTEQHVAAWVAFCFRTDLLGETWQKNGEFNFLEKRN
jgi:hypothetical protein